MESAIDTFDLVGPQWANLTCVLFYVLIILPLGIVIVRYGFTKRRLWKRARSHDYDNRKLRRVAKRLGLSHEFKGDSGWSRFRNRKHSVGFFTILIGLAAIFISLAVPAWVSFGGPARLQVSDSEFIIDFRWPRPDHRIQIKEVVDVDYHTSRGRGRRGAPRSHTQLLVTLRNGDILKIEPPGYSGNYEKLAAAGQLLAERANLTFGRTIVGNH